MLDNLERMSAPDHQFVVRMQSLVEVFARHADALRLPACHMIYSVPLYLERIHASLDRDYDGALQVLPTVKIRESPDAARTPHAPGVVALRKLLAERLPLDDLFASDEQVERVILASGGHLRALLKITETIVRLARRSELPVPDLVVDLAIDQYAEKLRDAVRADGVPPLDGIRRSFGLDHIADPDLPRLARYLDSNLDDPGRSPNPFPPGEHADLAASPPRATSGSPSSSPRRPRRTHRPAGPARCFRRGHLVHCYRNGDGWYDVHPLLLDHLQRLAAADVD